MRNLKMPRSAPEKTNPNQQLPKRKSDPELKEVWTIAGEHVVSNFEPQAYMIFHPVMNSATEVSAVAGAVPKRRRIAAGDKRDQLGRPVKVVGGSRREQRDSIAS